MIDKLADRVIVLAVVASVTLLSLEHALDGRAAAILGTVATAVIGVKAAAARFSPGARPAAPEPSSSRVPAAIPDASQRDVDGESA